MRRWVFDLREMTKHQWAFYYYCKRLGDRCYVDRRRSEVIVEVADV